MFFFEFSPICTGLSDLLEWRHMSVTAAPNVEKLLGIATDENNNLKAINLNNMVIK